LDEDQDERLIGYILLSYHNWHPFPRHIGVTVLLAISEALILQPGLWAKAWFVVRRLVALKAVMTGSPLTPDGLLRLQMRRVTLEAAMGKGLTPMACSGLSRLNLRLEAPLLLKPGLLLHLTSNSYWFKLASGLPLRERSIHLALPSGSWRAIKLFVLCSMRPGSGWSLVAMLLLRI
jgi:hypothetical protein